MSKVVLRWTAGGEQPESRGPHLCGVRLPAPDCSLATFALLAIYSVLATPAAAQQNYQALIMDGNFQVRWAAAVPQRTATGCSVPVTTSGSYPDTLAGLENAQLPGGYSPILFPDHSYLTYVGPNYNYVQAQGSWLPATWSNNNWGDPSIPRQSSEFGSASLSSNGQVTGSWFGIHMPNYDFSDPQNNGAFGVVHDSETLDLNTGAYQEHLEWVGNINDFLVASPCPAVVTLDITGTVQLAFSPIATPHATLSLLNPLACSINGHDCTDLPVPVSGDVTGQVISAPPAVAISADGRSAAVVMIRSRSSSAVQLNVAASGLSDAVGSLTTYYPGYLINPSPGAKTQVTIDSTSAGTSCNPDPLNPNQMNCIFLALLWSPAGMPASVLSSGVYRPIPLTVAAMQDTIQIQTTILLQPPPLVLIHGVWSNAAEAWPPFQQWLRTNYPHGLIFTADYGQYNYLAFTDPPIQNIFEGTVANALAAAATQGVVAGLVDVVAHSMGGLVTIAFTEQKPPYPLSYLPSDPVHQLITIGTPHLGSELATTLWNNRDNIAVTTTEIAELCAVIPSCTLGNLLAVRGKRVDTAVESLIPGHQVAPARDYSSIVGNAPNSSCTSLLLNLLLRSFVPGKTIDGLLGSGNDTIVSEASQYTGAANIVTINRIVHSSLCWGLDTGETASQAVWTQAAYWLMGGSGFAPAQASGSAIAETRAAPGALAPDQTAGLILDLSGYTKVPASSVTFLPSSNSTMTINSAIGISATSNKTITEILLFQTVSDPTDAPLLVSTQAPFSIAFTPRRLGSTTFVAFAVFNDNTYASTTLNYTFQTSGNASALKLLNPPLAALPLGSWTIVGAQALFANGAVDVSHVATYKVRSGSTNVFSVDSTGLVTAFGPGTDWLDVSYNGASSSAPISVGTCTYSLTPRNQLVGFGGGTATIKVTTQSGCAWTADDSGAPWLAVTSADGTGNGTITLVAAPNTTGVNQTAMIRVAGANAAVTQPATACTYDLSQMQISASVAGGSGTIDVTTSCPVIASSDQSWLTAVPLTSAVAYTVAPNYGGSQRAATLTIGTVSIPVTQAASSPPAI